MLTHQLIKLLCHQFLLKILVTCLNKAETRFPRLLIMGCGNIVMSCDGISFCSFFLAQHVITRISSGVSMGSSRRPMIANSQLTNYVIIM